MRKYTQQDGFSATNGYELEQDERGFLWIGTDNGGMSFDGKKFKGLLENVDFPDAEILAVKPLAFDRVLLIPVTHSVCYLDKGTLITEKEDVSLRDIRNANHNVTRRDPVTGAFWLSNKNRLTTLFRFSGKDIKRYDIGNANFFMESVVGNYFIGSLYDSKKKLSYPCIYNLAAGTYQYCYNEAGKKMSPSEGFINANGDTDYLVSYHRGARQICAYKYKKGDSILKLTKAIDLVSQNQGPTSLTLDHNRNLWVKFTGSEGIWYYGNILKCISKQEALHIQEPRMVNSIFIDRNSNLWMSSQNNALYFISRKHIQNALLTNRFPLKKEVPKSISGDGKGKLLVSYADNSNMACIDGTQYQSVPLNSFFVQGARGIIPIKNNRFLVFGNQVAIYNIGTNKAAYIKGSDLICKDVCLYRENDLLVASSKSVAHIESFRSRNPIVQDVFHGWSTSVDVILNGQILIGTPTGLYVKRSLKEKPVKISSSLLDRCNITDIQPLPDGGALIGTNAKGLLVYKADKGVETIKANELKHVRSIYKQNDSVYWISTNKGVYSFTFKHNWMVKEVKNYTFYDGLPSNNATSVYVYRDTAYVTTSEGIGILLLKDSTLLQMAAPDIYLNTIQTDKTTFWYPDSLLSLSPNQNDLLISLSAISYESLGNIQYYYRLYPLQAQWVHTTDPDIRFTQLPAGKYSFQAYALNAKGVKSQKNVSIDIHIQPTFWQTWFFKITLLAVAALLIYLSLRWWLLRNEKIKYVKMQDKKRLAELELEAIKAQINPHFIYNCLNSIQYLNYKAEHEQAQLYLSLFARLIRMTMQYSQQAFIPLREEADYLSLYLHLEKLRFKDKMLYKIDIEDGINKKAMLPAMLIQPYVENALKHGIAGKEKGEIAIRFWEESGKLQITVQDNGPGFADLKRPGALGLRLAGTRATSYNELFNLNINIHCYNTQDIDPTATGATIHIEMIYLPDYTFNKSAG